MIFPRAVGRSAGRSLPSVAVRVTKRGDVLPVKRPGSVDCTAALAAAGSTGGDQVVVGSGERSSDSASGDVAGAVRSERLQETAGRNGGHDADAGPLLAPVPYLPTSSPWLHWMVVAAVLLAVLLLMLAAVPPSVMRGPGTAHLLASWRAHIAAAGFSALLAAAVIFLVAGL